MSNAENTNTTYYMVRVDGKTWCKEPATASFFTAKGSHVQEARRTGEMSLFIGGRLVAHLFEKQSDQKAYLHGIGAI